MSTVVLKKCFSLGIGLQITSFFSVCVLCLTLHIRVSVFRQVIFFFSNCIFFATFHCSIVIIIQFLVFGKF